MNVLLCLSHSIEEFDQLRLFDSLGAGVVSLGGYIDPAHPHDPKRPPLSVPLVPSVKAAVDAVGGNGVAQSRIPDAALDWLGDDGVIVFHHYLDRLMGQWPLLRDWLRGSSSRRVIWRTVGQSNPDLEAAMAMLRRDGLEIVRYSPSESALPNYAGSDALIRFWKDPSEWTGWIGTTPHVTTVVQNFAQRDPFTNYAYWLEATEGLSVYPMGVGSEIIGGDGTLAMEQMQVRLREARAYLYTGTQPASYTLAFIEALMTGIPVVSIGPTHMNLAAWGPAVFESHLLTPRPWLDDPSDARRLLMALLNDRGLASEYGAECRRIAIEHFSYDAVAPKWAAFLGLRVAVAA